MVYDAKQRGNMDTAARMTREIPFSDAHCNHSFVLGLAIRMMQTRLPAWASIESPTPSPALFDVAKICDPRGSDLSPTIRSRNNLVKITCNSLGDFINSSAKMTFGLGSFRLKSEDT